MYLIFFKPFMTYREICRLDIILGKDNIFCKLNTIYYGIYKKILCMPFVYYNSDFY